MGTDSSRSAGSLTAAPRSRVLRLPGRCGDQFCLEELADIHQHSRVRLRHAPAGGPPNPGDNDLFRDASTRRRVVVAGPRLAVEDE